jgi:hypothetical protein
LQADPLLASKVNNRNEMPVDIFCFYNAGEIIRKGSGSPFIKTAITLMDYLPDKISAKTGYELLKILYAIDETLKSKYINKVCSAMGNVSQLMGQSLFQYTLLEVYAAKNDPIIIQALLSQGKDENINHQHGENKLSALHLALAKEANSDEEKAARSAVVKLLIENGADLDIADSAGVTCRHLLEQLADSTMAPWIGKIY